MDGSERKTRERARPRVLTIGQHLAIAGTQAFFGAVTGVIRLARGSHPDGWTTLRYGLHREEILDHMNPAERVRRREQVKAVADGRLIDAEGLWVEDFGLADNLMIVHGLTFHGCSLIAPRLPPLDPWHDLAAFEACVRLVAERLAPPPKPRPRQPMRAARRR